MLNFLANLFVRVYLVFVAVLYYGCADSVTSRIVVLGSILVLMSWLLGTLYEKVS